MIEAALLDVEVERSHGAARRVEVDAPVVPTP